ncbi:MAG: PTS sugar transporter subunit IIC [Brevinemataceae bacterium]
MNFQEFVEQKLNPAMAALGQQRHLQAIRDGIVINLVPSMIGSLFLLVAALPIPGYGEWIKSIGVFDALLIPIGATLDLMGLVAVIAISYRLAESYKADALSAAVISLLCFFILTPYKASHKDLEEAVTGVLPIMYLGSRGLFTALLVSLSATEIYTRLLKTKITINMPDGVPPAVARSFSALIPGGITLIVFWIVRLIIDYSSFENIHSILATFVSQPLTMIAGNLFGAIAFMFLVHFFWFFGIHGHLIVGAILDPVFTLLQDQNRIAFQAGQEIPNIITRYWFDLYVTLGGSGASLPIVIALALFARSRHLKTVGRLSLGPGIFNINEPFVFGIPVVFNPIIIFPWIIVPIVNICTAYFATIIGFLPRHNGIILPWTTPIFISGAIVAGWRGVVMQLINLIISAVIWFAFIKKLDDMEVQKELDSLK